MGTRLATVAPDLSAWLESLTEDQVRAVTLLGVRAALAQAGLTDPTVAEALELDRSDPDRRLGAAVEAVAARLDEEAWNIQDQDGDTDQYRAVFAQARAASAAFFMLDPDVRTSANEVLYEAQAALGSVDLLRTHISA